MNWLGQTNGYLGKVSVDVEAARFASDRPECSLNLQTPCDLDGTLVSTMPTVQALSFNVIDFNSFYQNYVGYPPTNAVSPILLLSAPEDKLDTAVDIYVACNHSPDV